jgi:hypothetical protein
MSQNNQRTVTFQSIRPRAMTDMATIMPTHFLLRSWRIGHEYQTYGIDR